jgi:hypothetical protein
VNHSCGTQEQTQRKLRVLLHCDHQLWHISRWSYAKLKEPKHERVRKRSMVALSKVRETPWSTRRPSVLETGVSQVQRRHINHM